jgi:PAS domain S-box-containing protein
MTDYVKPDTHYVAGLAESSLVPLETILCTDELARRPARAPDYEAENRALAKLVQALADSPASILQTLADTLLDVFKADSAGLSLLTEDGKSFYWPAIAGDWRPHLGGGTPRDFGPCGDVLDRSTPLLFSRWERRYPYLLQATPLAEEGLLVPFYVGGKAAGTIWAIAHTDRRRFDAEDLRQLESLGRFASAAYQAVQLQHAEEGRRDAVNLMEEAIRARHAVEGLNISLRDSEERYRTLFELGPVAVFSCDAHGKIQMFNRHALELWGQEPNATQRLSGAYKLLDRDGRTLPPEQWPVAKVLNGTPEVRAAELILERPDGSRLTVLANVRPLKNDRGEIIGAITSYYDITERKQAETRQQLLIDELNHRVKNTLATVQSIAAHSLTGAADAAARRRFDDRLIALSRTHDVLARASWEGASLRELLTQELEPFRSRSPFLLDGPDVALRPKAALALGLAFHELATNAAKYGALSAPTGYLRVSWQLLNPSPSRGLRLEWAEAGGPAVKKPPRRGFGLSVIERGLALELGGKVTLDFRPSGVICSMEIASC